METLYDQLIYRVKVAYPDFLLYPYTFNLVTSGAGSKDRPFGVAPALSAPLFWARHSPCRKESNFRLQTEGSRPNDRATLMLESNKCSVLPKSAQCHSQRQMQNGQQIRASRNHAKLALLAKNPGKLKN